MDHPLCMAEGIVVDLLHALCTLEEPNFGRENKWVRERFEECRFRLLQIFFTALEHREKRFRRTTCKALHAILLVALHDPLLHEPCENIVCRSEEHTSELQSQFHLVC